MIRVLIADDDAILRSGLQVILTSDDLVEIAAEATDGRGAVDLTDRHRPDVVLMDVRMPGVDGLTAAEEIRRRHPQQRIIVLTTFGESEYVRRAVALGVNGFLLKAGDPLDLLRGVHAVVAGGVCLSPSIAAMVMDDAQSATRTRTAAAAAKVALEGLPARERDALDLLARGRSNAEIAAALHLSEGTVKGYLTAAFARLGVRNRVEAALIVWQAR